jgi:hypothetical protein
MVIPDIMELYLKFMYRFGENVLSPGRDIPLDVENIVYNLRKIVLGYNNNQLNNHGVLNSAIIRLKKMIAFN